MRKRVLILAAAVALALVLAVPASASKSEPVGGTTTAVVTAPIIERTIGNRCFVTTTEHLTWTGSFVGESDMDVLNMVHGPCMGGPGFWDETNHAEEVFTGTVLGKGPGTIHITCSAKFDVDNPGWDRHCVLHSGTGGLANLHGTIQEWWPMDGPAVYWGQVHFDPK
jgi:hypothetical protein